MPTDFTRSNDSVEQLGRLIRIVESAEYNESVVETHYLTMETHVLNLIEIFPKFDKKIEMQLYNAKVIAKIEVLRDQFKAHEVIFNKCKPILRNFIYNCKYSFINIYT